TRPSATRVDVYEEIPHELRTACADDVVPALPDRRRHVGDPPGAARARAAPVRFSELHADPGCRADDRGHGYARQPRAMVEGRVLARRAERRALGLLVTR